MNRGRKPLGPLVPELLAVEKMEMNTLRNNRRKNVGTNHARTKEQTRNDTLPYDNIVEAPPGSYDRITGGSALKLVPVLFYNKRHV